MLTIAQDMPQLLLDAMELAILLRECGTIKAHKITKANRTTWALHLHNPCTDIVVIHNQMDINAMPHQLTAQVEGSRVAIRVSHVLK